MARKKSAKKLAKRSLEKDSEPGKSNLSSKTKPTKGDNSLPSTPKTTENPKHLRYQKREVFTAVLLLLFSVVAHFATDHVDISEIPVPSPPNISDLFEIGGDSIVLSR